MWSRRRHRLWFFESVWDGLQGSPAEAPHMRLRSDLMIGVQQAVPSGAPPQAKR